MATNIFLLLGPEALKFQAVLEELFALALTAGEFGFALFGAQGDEEIVIAEFETPEATAVRETGANVGNDERRVGRRKAEEDFAEGSNRCAADFGIMISEVVRESGNEVFAPTGDFGPVGNGFGGDDALINAGCALDAELTEVVIETRGGH